MDLKKVIYILDNQGNIQNAQNPVRSGRMGVSGERSRHDLTVSVQNTEKSNTCESERRMPC